MSDMQAFLSRDGSRVMMTTGRWQQTVPAADLDKWVKFYRGLWSRGSKDPKRPGPYASFFEQPLKALEEIQNKIRENR